MTLGAGILHDSEYFRVERLPFGSIVKVTRLPRTFETAAEVDVACRPVQLALDREGRANLAILLDSRLAIGKNDPQSEQAFARHRREMIVGFRRVAVVVQTPAGLLQLRRLVASDGTEAFAQVFIDESEAIAYLMSHDARK